MYSVFIDGSAGTTGLRIYERLSERKDLELITLPEECRKDKSAREKAINSADVVFLCLPDEAAIESVGLCRNDKTIIIDTSTAHRTNDNWCYGFPEISGYDKISESKRIANPGCHASGFIALVYPLVKGGILQNSANLSCFSITGYSGGGKKMIAQYQAEDRSELLCAPRQYALTQSHKHLPEMKKICGLKNEPAFCPVVSDFYSGMHVSVPISLNEYGIKLEDIISAYKSFYTGKVVHFDENCDEGGFMSSVAFSGKDDMQISLFGNSERAVLNARFDNLGKGASGSAVQNMNIALGLEEALGLVL